MLFKSAGKREFICDSCHERVRVRTIGSWIALAIIIVLAGLIALAAAAPFIESALAEGPIPSTASSWLDYAKAVKRAQASLTISDMQRQPDPAKQCKLLEKMLVTPMTELGYSFDESVRQAARDFNEGSLTVEDAQAVAPMTATFKQMSADLERCQFISAETAAELQNTKL